MQYCSGKHVVRAFLGFLRAAEITIPSVRAYDKGEHLNVFDILVDSVTNPTTMKLKTKSSKMDPFQLLCCWPYLVEREGMPSTSEDGRLLTRDRFVARVRQALTAAREDCNLYSSRNVAVTYAYKGHINNVFVTKTKLLKSNRRNDYH